LDARKVFHVVLANRLLILRKELHVVRIVRIRFDLAVRGGIDEVGKVGKVGMGRGIFDRMKWKKRSPGVPRAK
jgi:hypothetical protein